VLLKKTDPARADMLLKGAEKDVKRLQDIYKSLADIKYTDEK